MFTNKTLLITGGTGTFGNAVLRRFLSTDIAQVRVFSRDEKKQDDMRRAYRSAKLRFYIGDVRNEDSVRDAMAGVDYVFHAAALKQVPSCEFFPLEAIRTNALGAENVLTQAISAGVQRVVVLSTDKAVHPVNAMGISKAMMEKIAIAKSRVAADRTAICVTRYGNVMASRGSVIPLFLGQVDAGGPITVTDPTMTRFMMTIEDAVDLVLFAFTNGKTGDTFVQKAPGASIGTLAQAVRSLFAPACPINVIGTRHGEKQHETLLTREEMAVAQDMGNYFRVPCDQRDLNYNLYFNQGREEISRVGEYTSNNTRQLDVNTMTQVLLQLECVQLALAGQKVVA